MTERQLKMRRELKRPTRLKKWEYASTSKLSSKDVPILRCTWRGRESDSLLRRMKDYRQRLRVKDKISWRSFRGNERQRMRSVARMNDEWKFCSATSTLWHSRWRGTLSRGKMKKSGTWMRASEWSRLLRSRERKSDRLRLLNWPLSLK
jgi:hypothetical protein